MLSSMPSAVVAVVGSHVGCATELKGKEKNPQSYKPFERVEGKQRGVV